MTQEEKQLLLVDLCARLPYEVKIQVNEWTSLDTVLKVGHVARLINGDIELKPYLRPMNSMTEEEEKEFKKIVYDSMNVDDISASVYVADWLYSKHLDAHGLIPKGLAIEAPEGMYK